MKAQNHTVQLVALGGLAAGITLAAIHRHQPSHPVTPDAATDTLDRRTRAGILPMEQACALFAANARYLSEARWLLSAEPFERWKVAWMGLSRDVNFDKKYEHGFVVVYDRDRQPIMALHTMPNDRSADPLPNAMGDRNCVIDIFAVTMDASAALCEKRGHDELISSQLTPLTDPRRQAAQLQGYAEAVRGASFNYTVPIQPVRRELTTALRDTTTLADFEPGRVGTAMARRRRALHWIESRDDDSLARWLNPVTKYRLGAQGFNSNSGAADIMTLLGHKHSLDLIRAPFCDQSMLAALRAQAHAISAGTAGGTRLQRPHAEAFGVNGLALA